MGFGGQEGVGAPVRRGFIFSFLRPLLDFVPLKIRANFLGFFGVEHLI